MSGSSDTESSSSDDHTLKSKIGKIDVEFAPFHTKPVSQWKMKCVGAWLQSLGYDKFVDKFVDEMIDGESLVTLTATDLTNLGVKKIGERNKLIAKIAKLKANDRVTATESETSTGSESGNAGNNVKIVAMLKKKTVELTVSQTISLSTLLDKLANLFGTRVKIRVVDDDGEAIAVSSDDELANVLDGEDEVEIQCSKDLKAKVHKTSSIGSSSSASTSSEETKKKKSVAVAVDFSVFDSLLDGMVAIDEDGSVLAFNAAAEKAFGYARRKVIGQNVKMLMPDSYAKKHDHYLARYATTGVKNVIDKRRVVMAKAANGSMFPVELAVTEKSSAGFNYFVGVLKLMTDDAAASGAGAANGAAADVFASVRKTLNEMQEAAIVISETGRIEVFNNAASKLFGHATAAAIGQRVEMLMPSPHKENHAYYLSRYVSTGQKRVIGSSRNVTAVHADGSPLQVNLALSEEKLANGDMAFVGLLTPAVKHGAQKTTETVLQSMRKMVNSMTVPGVIINDKSIIQAFNKGAEELLGYQLIEVVGRNVNMLMNDSDAAKHDEYVAAYLTTGNAKVIGKERVLMAKHKNGSAVEIQLSVTEQSDNGKKIFIGMMHLSKSALDKARKTRKLKKESSKSDKSDKSGETSGGSSSAAPAPNDKK